MEGIWSEKERESGGRGGDRDEKRKEKEKANLATLNEFLQVIEFAISGTHENLWGLLHGGD